MSKPPASDSAQDLVSGEFTNVERCRADAAARLEQARLSIAAESIRNLPLAGSPGWVPSWRASIDEAFRALPPHKGEIDKRAPPDREAAYALRRLLSAIAEVDPEREHVEHPPDGIWLPIADPQLRGAIMALVGGVWLATSLGSPKRLCIAPVLVTYGLWRFFVGVPVDGTTRQPAAWGEVGAFVCGIIGVILSIALIIGALDD